jgi:hypothetical protein
MENQIFYIRSLAVQDSIMAIFLAIIAGLLIRFLLQGKFRHAAASFIWALIALWFFNGPLWGFSAVATKPDGLELHYGFLSVAKNTTLPLATPWIVRTRMGGLRRMKKLYYLELAGHKSLQVRGPDKLEALLRIGEAIDRLNGRPMGGMEPGPANR